MPDNQHFEIARSYHNATKHSYTSVRNSQHFLDFNNQPLPFKVYPSLEPSPLPQRSGAPLRVRPPTNHLSTRPGGHRPTAVSFRRHHAAQKISRRRNLLSRRRLHRGPL